jgi:hypothetical protein
MLTLNVKIRMCFTDDQNMLNESFTGTGNVWGGSSKNMSWRMFFEANKGL